MISDNGDSKKNPDFLETKRTIGLFSGVALIIGRIIGIYLSPFLKNNEINLFFLSSKAMEFS